MTIPNPGDPCRVGRKTCGIPSLHSHCGCGIPIKIGAGYCSACMRELMRGAIMDERPLRPGPTTPTLTMYPAVLELPEGHRSWQTTPTCRHGHPMNKANVYWTVGRDRKTYRACLECKSISSLGTERRASQQRAKERVRARGAVA